MSALPTTVALPTFDQVVIAIPPVNAQDNARAKTQDIDLARAQANAKAKVEYDANKSLQSAFWIVFLCAFICMFPVAIAELVIGFTYSSTTNVCEPIQFSSATWLIVFGFSSFFMMWFAILGAYCNFKKHVSFAFGCKLINWTIIAFRFAWTIIGATMVWKYCTDIDSSSVYVMMSFSVIYGLLAIVSNNQSK